MRRIFLLVILLTSGLFAASAPPTVASVAALQALLPGAYPTVQLLGYNSAGDGGGGFVHWISTSTKAAAACSVYVPTVTPAKGRWERPASPFRLARQCGIMTMDDTISGVVTYPDLAGSGTRMVVVSATGTTSTQSIPAGGSLANPTGTIGLAAVNGSATSGMRSDGAPALSQAIVPTWTGIHTHSPIGAGSASAIIVASSTPAFALNETDGGADNKWWDWNATAEQFRFRVVNDANSASTNIMTVDRTGTTVDAVAFPILSGSGTRMVVADATGIITTQSIPAGASLANPTATIGLTVVNGSATSGMRSDGAPALSQAISPTWTGNHTFATQISAGDGMVMTSDSGISRSVNTGELSLSGAQIQYDGYYGAYIRLFGGSHATTPHNWTIGHGVSQDISFNYSASPSTVVIQPWAIFPNHSIRLNQLAGTGNRFGTLDADGDLGTAGTIDGDYTLAGTLTHAATAKTPSTLGSTSGSIAIDAALSDFYKVTLTGNATLANPTNSGSTNVRHFTVRVKQDATGSRTLAYGNVYRFPGGVPPVLTTDPNAVDYLSFILDEDADKWDFVGNAFNLLPEGS